MEELGDIKTHTQDLENESKLEILAQVRPPEGNNATIRQDAPNTKKEGHDNHPSRDAKPDDKDIPAWVHLLVQQEV